MTVDRYTRLARRGLRCDRDIPGSEAGTRKKPLKCLGRVVDELLFV